MSTFEQYLQNKHAEHYGGLDDNMPDSFDEWLCDLDPQGIIDYAEEWHDSFYSTIKRGKQL